ncbi:MAG: RHS repeat-associated core domain-containing protein, partial [Candidatus Pacebacteria bacterium]|nr:RHS repeat-associated core domain-containing protein [Candidatus Paceibacterota bacterium]
TAMYTLRDGAVETNFTDYAAIAANLSAFDKSEWQYDLATGLLTNKLNADGNGTTYTYTPQGQLASRTWARGIVTEYSYDALNQLTAVAYSDATPAATFTYDRLGRQATVTDTLGTRAFVYDPDSLQLTAEQHAEGILSRLHDAQGRPVGLELFPQGSTQALYQVAYAYDALGRFASVTTPFSAAEYQYMAGSDLLTGWTQSGTGILPVSHTRAFEPTRNLITGIENMAGTNVVSSFAYTNDELARRTLRVDNAAVTNTFGYNVRSEVIEALLGLDQYDYAYDPIGNRLTASTPSTIATYTANELNQYTVISNGIPVEPTYDADGNMLEMSNGWTSTWDGENRLIEMVNGDARLVFDYDYMSRRVRKTVYEWNTDHWSLITDHFFIYDGWNVLLELDLTQTEPDIARAYVWGLDLSQTLQGTGGVGGLLSVTISTPSTPETFSTAFDANGNITEYVDSSGTVVAHYEYDAFGNTTAQSGAKADDFNFRFSTKYLDPETGLYYYGYRYYSPPLGRWVNRDPIWEWGGLNLYVFVENHPSGWVDILGLVACCGDQEYDPETQCCESESIVSKVTDDANQSCCPSEIVIVEIRVRRMGHHGWRDPGHAFVATPGVVRGYYPARGGIYTLTGPGEVRDDSTTRYDPSNTYSYRACPVSVSRLQEIIGEPRQEGIYDLLNLHGGQDGRNCAGWACQAFEDAGFTAPFPPDTPFLVPRRRPGRGYGSGRQPL